MRRVYRELFDLEGFESFEVSYKKSDLFIKSCSNNRFDVFLKLKDVVSSLEAYIERRGEFLTSLKPIGEDKNAPYVAKRMIQAAAVAGVGPMAAVAGAVAEAIGRFILKSCRECVVENGGDIFLKLDREARIGVYTSNPHFKDRLAIGIEDCKDGLGVCSSSATIGPSLSLGRADLAMVIDGDCAIADALATASANMVKSEGDIEKAMEFVKSRNAKGCLFIKGKKMGIWGNIKLL